MPKKYPINQISIIPRPAKGPYIAIEWLWSMPHDGPLLRFFEERLNTPEGVEEAAIGRYSAVIVVADHVSPVDAVAEALYELLTDPSAAEFLSGQFPEGYVVEPPLTRERLRAIRALGRT